MNQLTLGSVRQQLLACSLSVQPAQMVAAHLQQDNRHTCTRRVLNIPFAYGEVGRQMKSMTFPSGDSSCLQVSFLRLKIDMSAPLLQLSADEVVCPPE